MSQFEFQYEDIYHPRLRELLEREPIRRVIANSANGFEQLLLLRHWVASQWIHRWPNPYPRHDAIEILENARAGGGGYCGQFAVVYLQCCLALSHHARFVELGSLTDPVSHFITEVWLPELGKWAVMEPDSTLNACYVLKGQEDIPLSALEIHEKVVADQIAQVDMVSMWPRGPRGQRKRFPYEMVRDKWVSQFYYLRVVFKQDFLSNPCRIIPHDDTFERYETAVEWRDDKTVPWEDSEHRVSYAPNKPLCRRETRCKEDLYFKPRGARQRPEGAW